MTGERSDAISDQAIAIRSSMFHLRLCPHTDYARLGWKVYRRESFSGDPGVFIDKALKAGRKVRAGYFTTSVRGYHEYCILVKELDAQKA